MFAALNLGRYGLELWASGLSSRQTWFPDQSENVIWNISGQKLPTGLYVCLKRDFIEQMYISEVFQIPEKSDFTLTEQPGSKHIVTRPCDEEKSGRDKMDQVTANTFQTDLAGFVRLEAVCPHARHH